MTGGVVVGGKTKTAVSNRRQLLMLRSQSYQTYARVGPRMADWPSVAVSVLPLDDTALSRG